MRIAPLRAPVLQPSQALRQPLGLLLRRLPRRRQPCSTLSCPSSGASCSSTRRCVSSTRWTRPLRTRCAASSSEMCSGHAQLQRCLGTATECIQCDDADTASKSAHQHFRPTSLEFTKASGTRPKADRTLLAVCKNRQMQDAHNRFVEEREPVHALQRVRRGRHVREDDPRLAAQLVSLDALHICNLPKLRKEAVQALLQLCTQTHLQILGSQNISVWSYTC